MQLVLPWRQSLPRHLLASAPTLGVAPMHQFRASKGPFRLAAEGMGSLASERVRERHNASMYTILCKMGKATNAKPC